MRSLKILLIGGALALASGVAVAFDEQKGGAAKPAAGAAQPGVDVSGKATGLSGTDTAPPKSPTGTEIRIPGLGPLGVIPKLDFGLELLYGAADPKRAGAPDDKADPEPGVMLRGTIKLKQ